MELLTAWATILGLLTAALAVAVIILNRTTILKAAKQDVIAAVEMATAVMAAFSVLLGLWASGWSFWSIVGVVLLAIVGVVLVILLSLYVIGWHRRCKSRNKRKVRAQALAGYESRK